MPRIMNLKKLIFSILLCEFAVLLGTFFARPAIEGWYRTLAQPKFAPPDIIFTPIWVILYLLLGISLYLIWERGIYTEDEKIAVLLFVTQIVLYVAWSIFFFRFKELFTALVDLFGLLIALILNINYFYKISKTAAFLLFPYLLWIVFLLVVNYAFYLHNG